MFTQALYEVIKFYGPSMLMQLQSDSMVALVGSAYHHLYHPSEALSDLIEATLLFIL